ncbi:hypothetical protein AVEN_36177-2 [Araneus ventricosus]|uniref:Uncharacterized protein n=1 Tax=Araneus ventricosus TaxID=182803 RepID=A0A4Y2PUD5_ARAVE|nr:hypothetical protein AVEN_36177-1 [Araneus ventricosus]GBN54181.1 hypothetical protein AVEN_36177-2 [Araneus ventricosus]
MWFQHDGPPAIDVRLHLNATYGQQWVGRGGPVLWPARSPDLTCLDYFLWGYVKSLVYETPVNNAEDIVASIAAAAGEVQDTPDIFSDVRSSKRRRCEAHFTALGRNLGLSGLSGGGLGDLISIAELGGLGGGSNASGVRLKLSVALCQEFNVSNTKINGNLDLSALSGGKLDLSQLGNVDASKLGNLDLSGLFGGNLDLSQLGKLDASKLGNLDLSGLSGGGLGRLGGGSSGSDYSGSGSDDYSSGGLGGLRGGSSGSDYYGSDYSDDDSGSGGLLL